MVSRIILRLINETVVPAVLVVAAKFVGIILTVSILGITWGVSYDGLIPRITFASPEDYVIISSWSTFFVILAIAGGLGWVLVKALVFHDTHVTPHLTLRLLSLDLTQLLTTTVEISHQATVWLAYLWLMVVLAGVQAYLGYFYGWMLALSLLAAVLLTWFFILDLEREAEYAS